MDENHNRGFMNFLNSPNVNENSSPQSSRIRPNSLFPSNVSNVPHAPLYPQYLQNNPNSTNNATQAPFGWCPPEYWSTMGSQYFMPSPTYNHYPPPPPSTMPSDESRRASTDKASTDKESDDPPHCSQLGLEDFTLNTGSEKDDEVEVVEESGWTQWTYEEEIILAKSIVTISVDSVVGNYQKTDAYWTRVKTEYNTNWPAGSVARTLSSLKSHDCNWKWPLNKFAAEYKQIWRDRPSGWNDDDVLAEAQRRWMIDHKNKPFKWVHVWKILKTMARYAPQSDPVRGGKKARTSESGAQTSSSNPDLSADNDDSEFPERPMGQKAAKKKSKGKAKAKANTSVVEEINAKLDKTLEVFQAESQKKTERADDALYVRHYKIYMKKTEGMTEEQLKVHNQMLERIRKKWGWV